MALPEPLTSFQGPVNIRVLADHADLFIKKHTIMTKEERSAIVLWSLSTYGYDIHRIFPRLAIISPLRRCGKSTLLEVLGALCKNVVSSSNLTTGSIIRIKQKIDPTLIIDEADTFIANADGDLRGILNAGHSKANATVLRCHGEQYEMKPFDVWFPIAFASIGEVYETLMDRSVVIRLRRKREDEKVARMGPDVYESFLQYRMQVFTWFEQNLDVLMNDTIEPDFIGNDRARDNWIPLFTVANAISEEWLDRCTSAYKSLTVPIEDELPVQLLKDVYDILSRTSEPSIGSTELANQLKGIDTSPWASSKLSTHKLCSMLGTFGIKTKTLRINGKVLRGYIKEAFTDAFERYI